MTEAWAGMSPFHAEALLEHPSPAESAVGSREAPDPGDVLDGGAARLPEPSGRRLRSLRSPVRITDLRELRAGQGGQIVGVGDGAGAS